MRRFGLLVALLVLIAIGLQRPALGDERDTLLAQTDEAYNTGRSLEGVPVTERILALCRR